MRENSRVNRQQQVKVVVRLRPEVNESRTLKSVYLSNQDENQLVVETDLKKQIFMFDHIAHQFTSQQDLYRMIGQQCVQQTLEGYNCCIFAYGQTGAGKTYSVIGSQNDLTTDPYCSSRGILPRVLEDIFQMVATRQQEQKTVVTCSYIEIYNEQLFDLLSSDKRIHQIRQDAKKGVFVEGLFEKKVSSYKTALGLLLEGQKTRKMASTSMNTQSSRSHAIFTILIECQTSDEQIIKTKKAKLHIVDLAGSERVKHTNVQGERLRQGCNINKSLHVLCNVINSLAESSKKKRHIPFRDSKLTHYLKDSLGGNSITKLLANIHTGRQYFGDTLSTLMFAKRTKSLKLKVELNETVGENFDALRKEVRRLREQLAQTRYFKLEGRMSDRSTFEVDAEPSLDKIDKIPLEQTELDMSGRNDTLKALEQNQLHYKVLIEIYEQHMKTCLSSSNFQRKQNINIVKEWKNLEKRNISLTHLVRQIPTFTKIYKQNLLLKDQRVKIVPKQISLNDSSVSSQFFRKDEGNVNSQILQKIVEYYEMLIGEMNLKFRQTLQTLQKSYYQLQSDCKSKDKKIKDLKQRREYPPDIEQLKNQNEYLHLNILNLQDQIKKLQQQQQRMVVQLKQSKKSTAKKGQNKHDKDQDQDDFGIVYQRLMEIKHEADNQSAQFDLERAEMQMVIQKLQAEINKYMAENNRIKDKYSQSKSRKRSQKGKLQQVKSMHHSSSINNLVSTPEQKQMFKSQIKYLKNSALSVVSGNQDLQIQQHNYTKDILVLKMDIKRKQKQVLDVKKQLEGYINGDKRLQEEFGKPLDQIIEEYRQIVGRRTLQQSKSVKVFQRMEEQKGVKKMRQSYKKEPPKRSTANGK